MSLTFRLPANAELDDLIDKTLRALWVVHDQIRLRIEREPVDAFANVQKVPAASNRPSKRGRDIDFSSETNMRTELYHIWAKHNPHIMGEESLPDELDDDAELTILLDTIDGTDLLERALSNWCTAIVIFSPRHKKILAACIAMPDDVVYVAREDAQRPKKYKRSSKDPFGLGKEDDLIMRHNAAHKIEDASIAFTGQKIISYLAFADALTEELRELHNAKAHEAAAKGVDIDTIVRTRIYNLGGMPMMMKMLDGYHGAAGIDAVLGLRGAYPHDVIAGAYIALKGGAVMYDLDTCKYLGASDLFSFLLTPQKRTCRYITASTRELAESLITYLIRHADTIRMEDGDFHG